MAGPAVVRMRAIPVCARWHGPFLSPPLDLFRIAVGLLTLAYLVRLYVEAPLWCGPNALLEPGLSLRALPFTWQPFFHPAAPLWTNRALLGGGAVLSVLLTLGWRPRRVAFALFVLVVCSIRSRFLIASIDDGIVHLLLFWAILLPLDRSPRLGREPKLAPTVPGVTARALDVNFALIYLVAGGSKWLSPMWREGSALHAVLSLRPSFWSGAVDDLPAPAWRALSWAALVVEPLFALLVVLTPGSRPRIALGAVWLAFHLGIIFTFDVALANLGCLALGLVVFRVELAALLGRPRACAASAIGHTRAQPFAPAIACTTVALLTGAMATSLTDTAWRQPEEVAAPRAAEVSLPKLVLFGPLWCLGLMQQYRLLDWIDERNFVASFRLTVDGEPCPEFDERWLAPCNMRGTLTLSYLLGPTWTALGARQMEDTQRTLRARLAARVAPRITCPGLVVVEADVRRVRLGHTLPCRRTELVRFDLRPDGAVHLRPLTEAPACVASSP